MGLRPTQGDEKRLLPEATLSRKRRPHLCHPEEPTCLRQVKSEMNAGNRY
jgi:hypothetical protein